MHLVVDAATDVGRVREINEDAFLVDPKLGLFIVCDGMGGHSAGEVAANTTVKFIHDFWKKREKTLAEFEQGAIEANPIAALLGEAIAGASIAVSELGQADKSKRGLGTTCTALIIRGGRGVLGHVGDSRLYLARDGQLYQLSEDHTFVAEAVKYGMMTPEEARTSSHSNVLTRAVGAQRVVRVDTLCFDVLPGDAYLLCSDGLHQYTEDPAELQGLLNMSKLEGLSKKLTDLALDRGGHDNITAIVLRAEVRASMPHAEVTRAEGISKQFEALRHVDLFADLAMPELVRVLAAFRAAHCTANEIVLKEGESSEALFVIVSGSMEVLRGGEMIAILGAGSHFGEMALLNQRPRAATVRALEESQLMVLDRGPFIELLQQDAVLSTRLLWRLAQTLSARLDDVLMLKKPAESEPLDLRRTQKQGTIAAPFSRR